MRQRYFIPVCLYPHTKYRTTAGVTALFSRFQLDRSEYLIVIADRLLALDTLVTGRYWSLETVFAKARREATQIYKLFRRISHKMHAQELGRIVYWDDVGETAEFKQFEKLLREKVLGDQQLSDALEELADRRVKRFGLRSSPEKELGYEREYLLSEVCMSVFCTEILGYRQEIWERPVAPGVPDPIRLLYNEHPQAVAWAAGQPTRRVLKFLYEECLEPISKLPPAVDPI